MLRGVGGGLVFGIPLIYTMEVGWLGKSAQPQHALVALVVTFVPVYLLVASSGFRSAPDLTRLDVLVDVVTVIGLSLVSVTIVLVVLQRITLTTPLPIVAQTVVFQAVPFSIGAAVAREVFGQQSDKPQPEQDRGYRKRGGEEASRGTMWDLGATAVGAIFIALSIAPTDEVSMFATGIETPWLAVLIAFSLLVTYAIVFVAGFSDQQRRRQQPGLFQHPLTETAIAYLISLGISAAMLWLFGNLDATAPLGAGLIHAVVLSFPASIGGAAGRLVI